MSSRVPGQSCATCNLPIYNSALSHRPKGNKTRCYRLEANPGLCLNDYYAKQDEANRLSSQPSPDIRLESRNLVVQFVDEADLLVADSRLIDDYCEQRIGQANKKLDRLLWDAIEKGYKNLVVPSPRGQIVDYDLTKGEHWPPGHSVTFPTYRREAATEDTEMEEYTREPKIAKGLCYNGTKVILSFAGQSFLVPAEAYERGQPVFAVPVEVLQQSADGKVQQYNYESLMAGEASTDADKA